MNESGRAFEEYHYKQYERGIKTSGDVERQQYWLAACEWQRSKDAEIARNTHECWCEGGDSCPCEKAPIGKQIAKAIEDGE